MADKTLEWMAVVIVGIAVLALIVTDVGGTEEQPSVIGTGAAQLENGDVVCVVTGTAKPCISRDLPVGLRKSLTAMLARGFDAPPKPPCPQPICPQPICYERDDPDQWLGVPNAPGTERPQHAPH